MSAVPGGLIFTRKQLFEERIEEQIRVQGRLPNGLNGQNQKHLLNPASMSQRNGAAADPQCRLPDQVPIIVTLTRYVTDQSELEATDIGSFVKLAQDTVDLINGQDGITKAVYFIVKKEIGGFVRPSSSNSNDQGKPVFCVTINGADLCSPEDSIIRDLLTSDDWKRTSTIYILN